MIGFFTYFVDAKDLPAWLGWVFLGLAGALVLTLVSMYVLTQVAQWWRRR